MATSSCVSAVEQNELVVRTGLELRLRKLDVEMIKGKTIYVIGSKYPIEYWMSKLIAKKDYHYFLQDRQRVVFTDTSILEINKEYRSRGVVICFDEPSYNGRQCLYHLFGERLGLKPYQAFVDAMEQTQRNGDAIVFGLEEVMWFPGSKEAKKAPDAALYAPLAELKVVEAIPRGEFGQFDVGLLPPTLKGYVERQFPQTEFVDIGKVKGGTTYLMWGWNSDPETRLDCKWASIVRAEEPTVAEEPVDTKWTLLQTQVTALAAMVKALQETLAGLQAPDARN